MTISTSRYKAGDAIAGFMANEPRETETTLSFRPFR
jgi:hypothetical protein